MNLWTGIGKECFDEHKIAISRNSSLVSKEHSREVAHLVEGVLPNKCCLEITGPRGCCGRSDIRQRWGSLLCGRSVNVGADAGQKRHITRAISCGNVSSMIESEVKHST